MKKLQTTTAYKKRQKAKMRRALRTRRKINKRQKQSGSYVKYIEREIGYEKNIIRPVVEAPKDFRLLENTEACFNFFKDVRSKDFRSYNKNQEFVEMSLTKVEKIDYATISVLTAINDSFKVRGISFRGNFPSTQGPKNYLIDSGFLNSMFDIKGNPFPKTKKSEVLIFEKGSEIFSLEENIRISRVVQNISNHLINVKQHNPPLRTILLEIFANSIEWGQAQNKQWLLGVKYDKDRVILTVTDIGKGIIRTLHKRFGRKFFDALQFKSNSEILKGAFARKYGSRSQKSNRNKGLPSIKRGFDKGFIKELKVITNNVILHFDSEDKTRSVKKGVSWFKGTLYRCVITKDCLPN